MSDVEKLTAEEREYVELMRPRSGDLVVMVPAIPKLIAIIDRLSRPTPAVTREQIISAINSVPCVMRKSRENSSSPVGEIADALLPLLSGATATLQA